MKPFLGLTLCAALVPAIAGAAVLARYRITLQDGREVVSADLPVHRGSVVTFHEASSGVLTGLPDEEIVAIEAATRVAVATQRPSTIDALVRGERTVVEAPVAPLQPGDVVDVGPTGGGVRRSSTTRTPRTPRARFPWAMAPTASRRSAPTEAPTRPAGSAPTGSRS